MVIIAHGNYDILEFSSGVENQVGLSLIDEYVSPACEIDLLDIQACTCGDMRYDESLQRETCVAYEFARKQQIKKVYAWSDECKFALGYAYSLRGNYYVFTSIKEGVSIERVGFISKLFKPLEY